MYTPPAFAETDQAVIDALIEDARLALLVTSGEGLAATHLPVLYDPHAQTLTGHLARANPHRALARAGEAMVVITGPDAYVSPRWYQATGKSGRHVPTWNYEAAHLYGRLTWFDEPSALRGVVEALTRKHEAPIAPPWSLAEADPAYVEGLLRAIVGVRLDITRVEATRKLSQNRDSGDRRGVIEALEASDSPRDREIAARMRTREL